MAAQLEGNEPAQKQHHAAMSNPRLLAGVRTLGLQKETQVLPVKSFVGRDNSSVCDRVLYCRHVISAQLGDSEPAQHHAVRSIPSLLADLHISGSQGLT